MRFGLDYLLGGNYAALIKSTHPAGWAAGFILNTTTQPTKKPNCWSAIKNLLRTKKCPEIRLHAVWDDQHKYNKKRDLPVIVREATRAIAVAKQYQPVWVQFSPFCEHTIGKKDLEDIYSEIRKLRGSEWLTLVNSNWRGAWLRDIEILNEIHGGHKIPPGNATYNYSYDGQNCFDSDVMADRAKHKNAHTYYFWHPSMNGRLATGDTTPRPKRKAWPYKQELASAAFLATDSGVNGKLPKGYLWKSHADRHTTPPEPRAGKPVLICPVAQARIQVRSGKKVLATLSYAGAFSGGGFRYYCPEFGYVLAKRAQLLTGSPVCELVIGGKVVAKLNPGFRAGHFR